MTSTRIRMPFQRRRAKDSGIIFDVAHLSLPKRWKRLQQLAKKLTETEAAFEKNRSVRERTKKQQRELLAQEDGIIELKYRLQLEKVEYLNLKMITPDFEEVSAGQPGYTSELE
jgi:hypothetical protein